MADTVFVSNQSFEDAAFKAKMAGYSVVGMGRNKHGQFVVFARVGQRQAYNRQGRRII